MSRNLPVSAARIAADIEALAAITEPDRPWTRRAFTPVYRQGRDYLAEQFRAAGLAPRIDAAGNLIGHRSGRRPERGTIMIGSHSDTVPDGGRFDGVAGVVAALEVARALAETGIELEHDLEIVDFLAEEVSIFGVSCIGSRGLVGERPADWLERQADGFSLRQAIAEVGGHPDILETRRDIRAFLELHIEQGPVLENEGLEIGVVTTIAGVTRIELVVNGRADHAGTTPMEGRCDALSAAARLVLAIEALGRDLARGPAHFAATVGEFEIAPNAANVVPSRARMLIDARSEKRADMETFMAAIPELVAAEAAASGVTIEPPLTISDNFPTPCHEDVVDVLEDAAAALGTRHRRMVSGAGHDTAFMTSVTRAGMIFIPCRGGRSHTPEEWAETAEIALGAATLLEAVRRLDRD